ncbi:MAG: FIST N-terminal domain-containing protein, partial [Microthrixaceae bacterium]
MSGRPRAAAALSEHPLLTHAVGECVGHLLERGGPEPDLLVLCVTEPVAGALEDVQGATRRLLGPRVLVGSSSSGVSGGALQVDGRAAVSMFAVWFERGTDDPGVRPVRLGVEPGIDGDRWSEPTELRDARGTLLLFADSSGPRLEQLGARLATIAPDLVVVGGAPDAASGHGARLLLDGATHRHGAVGVLLSTELPVHVVVSQGHRAIGPTFTVTSSERNLVRELGGRPALERLLDAAEELPPEDRALAATAVHLGWTHVEEPDPEDFLVREVLGADRATGAIAVGAPVEVGAAARFHLYDRAGAEEDLLRLAAPLLGSSGAFAFVDASRGARLFGLADHDASTLSD